MSIKINEDDFKIYDLDTMESIMIRLAADYNLLPELLNLKETPESVVLYQDRQLKHQITINSKVTCTEVITQTEEEKLKNRSFVLRDFSGIVANLIPKAGSVEDYIKIKNDILDWFPELKENKSEEEANLAYLNFLLYFYYSRKVSNFNQLNSAVFFNFAESVDKILGYNADGIKILLSGYDYQKKLIDRQIAANKVKNIEHLDYVKSLGDLEEEYKFFIKSSPIDIIKVSLLVKFYIKEDIYNFFDRYNVTQEVPMISIGPFFKILKGFTPSIKWSQRYEKDNLMVLYVLNRRDIPPLNQPVNENYYSVIFINPVNPPDISNEIETDEKGLIQPKKSIPNDEKKDEITYIEMTIDSNLNDDIKEIQLLNRILGNIVIYDCQFRQNQIEAKYSFLEMANDQEKDSQIPFDEPIFYDLVANNDTVSNLLVINEDKLVYRQRGGVVVYFSFDNFVDSKFKCNLFQHVLTSNDQLRAKYPILFDKIGTRYITVRFKTNNLTDAQRFKRYMNIIMSLYYVNRDDIIDTYLKYIPDIRKELAGFQRKKIIQDAPVTLGDIFPKIFLPGYSRKCGHAPIILQTKEERKTARDNKEDIMYWPKAGSLGAYRRAYVCRKGKHVNVGLSENNLENKDMFPELPCCFPANQLTKKNSPRYRYENETKTEVANDYTYFIKSNKILARGRYGLLPPNILLIMQLNDVETMPLKSSYREYVRQGTEYGPNSCFDAIAYAIKNHYQSLEDNSEEQGIYRNKLKVRFNGLLLPLIERYDDFDSTEKNEYYINLRKALKILARRNLAAQSSYNYNITTLIEYLNNDRQFLDLKIVWNLIEELFDIQLLLFSRTENYPNGILDAPYAMQEYLQSPRRKTGSFYVMLFETIGSEVDQSLFPQYEIIKQFNHINNKSETSVSAWFSPDEDIIIKLNQLFNQIYAFNNHLNYPLEVKFNSKITSQCSDFFGKIRLLQFVDICIMTDPLPSLLLTDLVPDNDEKDNSTPRCIFKPVSIATAQKFLAIEKITDPKQVIVSDYLVGWKCQKRNKKNDQVINFYIPLIPSKITASDKTSTNISTAIAPSMINSIGIETACDRCPSILKQFIILNRVARYLSAYTLYIFSLYYHSNPPPQMLIDHTYLRTFANNKFRLIPNHQYPDNITRYFQSSLTGVYEGGKLIVPSVEAMKRLIYYLQQSLRQNRENVINYYRQIYINDYYTDINDFTQSDAYILLYTEKAVRAWIAAKAPKYIMSDRIINATAPYFFSNINLGNKIIYLAQPAESVANALYLCDTWNNSGINVGTSLIVDAELDQGFDLILYNSPVDMTIEYINGGNDNRRVLQYRSGDVIYSLSLLIYNTRE